MRIDSSRAERWGGLLAGITRRRREMISITQSSCDMHDEMRLQVKCTPVDSACNDRSALWKEDCRAAASFPQRERRPKLLTDSGDLPSFSIQSNEKTFFLGIRSGITLYHDLSTCFPSTTQHLVAFLRGSLSYLPCDDGSSMPLENWRGNGPTSGRRRRRRKKKRFIVPVISVSFLRPWRSLSGALFFMFPPTLRETFHLNRPMGSCRATTSLLYL